jgi:hypothetical protein
MAKGTSFAAKAKGKKKKTQTLVKYIKSVKSDKTGHWRFNEQMIALEDSENLDGALQRLKDETLALDMKLPNPEGDTKESTDVQEEPVEEAVVVDETEEEAKKDEEAVVDAVEEKEEVPEVEPKEELTDEENEAAVGR